MIVFDLQCRDGGEVFEGWFDSNAGFERQLTMGLVTCPFCQSSAIEKAPMAPRVARQSSEPENIVHRLAVMQAELLSGSEWVGSRFAETARAMHMGELETARVHGQATIEQAQELFTEGVAIAPLPFPIVPPDQVN